ncbi:MAG: GTP-binding protein HflX [Phycisphaerales bacterium]|jgi:GTP-binding protein HflX
MPPPKERENIRVQAERTVLAAVRLPNSTFDRRDPFGELRELARQAGGLIVGEIEQNLARPVAGTYMGKGKIDELRNLCDTLDATTVIFDHDLSPNQIASIEEVIERKILDRSELILDIFASRASTHEAKLQVELAQLEYTYPRLRAMWDHLERIVGGSPGGVGTRGPGEQQLEIDRRLVQQRKKLLTAELEGIQARKRRAVQQRNLEHFTVGLVGYTNAGKSTLFNSLTAGGAYADDRLFATLMTRTREWPITPGGGVLLSDTVGFVRDLPHHLVASFRATLEEATHADVLLIVVDVSDPAAEMHYQTVTDTLDELVDDIAKLEAKAAIKAERNGGELPRYRPPQRIVLLNKTDRLTDPHDLQIWLARVPDAIPVSSLAGEEPGTITLGHDALTRAVLLTAEGESREVRITVPLSDSKTVHRIEKNSEVHDRDYSDDNVTLHTTISLRQLAVLRATGATARVQATDGEPLPTADDERSPWRD